MLENKKYDELIKNVNSSLSALLQTGRYYLYQILLSEKFFGNIVVDVKSELLVFRFISDRDDYSSYVYSHEKNSHVYLLNDVFRYINIASIKSKNQFFEYLRDNADAIYNNNEKIHNVLCPEDALESLEKVVVKRDKILIFSELPYVSILFKAD